MKTFPLIFFIITFLSCAYGVKWDAIVSYYFQTPNVFQTAPLNKLTQQDINTSLKQGERLMRVVSDIEAKEKFPSHAMKNFFGGGLSPEIEALNIRSKSSLLAAKILQNKYVQSGKTSENSFVSFLQSRGYKGLPGKSSRKSCFPDKFQSFDGSCNNLERPIWGSANTPYTRIAPHKYADGLYSMPVAKSGKPLPSPRLISSRLFKDNPAVNQIHTMLSAHWGQIIAHDLSMGVIEQTKLGGIQCCLQNGSGVLSDAQQHSACAPVEVPQNEPFYSKYNVKYLNFVRSVTTPNLQGSLGPAEQLNTVSSYIDGSPIYSNEQEIMENIRTYRKGSLKLNKNGLLPSASNSNDLCDTSLAPGCPCYTAGDARVNQTPILAALHTILAREHNRIAHILSIINPHWNDERLFRETRRIVIAIIQHITYQEWLPLTIGNGYVRKHKISPTSLFTFDYNPNINAGVSNGFASAAFRYFHTLIPGEFKLLSKSGKNQYFKLRDNFMRPGLLEEEVDGFDSVIRGALSQPAMEADDCFSSDLTNFFFKSTNPWGLDLMTVDMQRGRDHGLEGYNTYRGLCGFPVAKDFSDLLDTIPAEKVDLLKTVYEDVDDIDLLVGGIFESDAEDSILGPTFQCIIGEQFYRSRVGDRYFYDIGDMPHSFTPAQMKEIKKMTMARLLCENCDNLTEIQKRVFEVIGPNNPMCECHDYEKIPAIDFTYWREVVDYRKAF